MDRREKVRLRGSWHNVAVAFFTLNESQCQECQTRPGQRSRLHQSAVVFTHEYYFLPGLSGGRPHPYTPVVTEKKKQISTTCNVYSRCQQLFIICVTWLFTQCRCRFFSKTASAHICGLVRVCHLWCGQGGNLPDCAASKEVGGRRDTRAPKLNISADHKLPAKLQRGRSAEKCKQGQAGCNSGIRLPDLLLNVFSGREKRAAL